MNVFGTDGASYGAAALALSMALALINCFYGYKLQKVWIGLICFCVGVVGGYIICANFLELTWMPSAAVGIALGGLLAFLSMHLFLVGIFLYVFGVSLWTCMLFLNDPIWIGMAIGTLAGLLAGFVAVRFTRPVTIVATALTGGLSAVQSLLLLLPAPKTPYPLWLPLAIGSVLAVCGIVLQYRTERRLRRRRAERAKARETAQAPLADTQKLGEPVASATDAATTQPAAPPTGIASAPLPLSLDVTEHEPEDALRSAETEAAPEAPALPDERAEKT
ncbi:MAG: TMEM198/TM7SF3 family protein [Clostridia bacterium]|nr:TMEM198/TM7SF3 family protein [Clostridia bacterium]